MTHNSSFNMFRAANTQNIKYLHKYLLSTLKQIWFYLKQYHLLLNHIIPNNAEKTPTHNEKIKEENPHPLVVVGPYIFHQDFLTRNCLCQTLWQTFPAMITCSRNTWFYSESELGPDKNRSEIVCREGTGQAEYKRKWLKDGGGEIDGWTLTE